MLYWSFTTVLKGKSSLMAAFSNIFRTLTNKGTFWWPNIIYIGMDCKRCLINHHLVYGKVFYVSFSYIKVMIGRCSGAIITLMPKRTKLLVDTFCNSKVISSSTATILFCVTTRHNLLVCFDISFGLDVLMLFNTLVNLDSQW